LAIAPGVHLCAQADTVKYKERAAAVAQEVWGWKLPVFANYKVPDNYANESSVIVARRAVIEADSKRKMDWGFLGPRRNFYYNSTVRELVKINDKVSLDEYSQLTYQQFMKLNSWLSTTTATTFVGARIIKPDGKIRQVPIDESILLKSGSNGWERKLAIGDLQVGDLLDYYIRVEEYSVSFREPERLIFVFGDDHPILDYSIHCNIGNKYAVEYHSMNKAPQPRETSNPDNDLILDLEMKNLAAVPTDLWMATMRELPAFRINVLAGNKAYTGRSTGEVIKDVPLSDVLKKYNAVLTMPLEMTYSYRNQMIKMLKAMDKHYNKLPNDSIAYMVYYAFRFMLYYDRVDDEALEVGEERNHMRMNRDLYLVVLRDLLREFKIDNTMLASTSRYGPAIKEVMNRDDLVLTLRVDGTKPFYITCDNMFTCPEYLQSYLEGQPFIELHGPVRGEPDDSRRGNLPISSPADNLHQETMQVDFSNDMQLLHIKRKTLLTGKMKIDEQMHLLNFEDCYEKEMVANAVEKSVMDQLKKQKKKSNVSEDYATALMKARASLKDRFKSEIASEFDKEPKELLSYKVDNPGIRHTAPDLAYTTEFTLDGLVQRAGNNFLVNVGKTFSSPLVLTPSQRTRSVDVYMPFARTLDATVALAIPAGYTVQGLDKLNSKVENGSGSFFTSAQVENNKLVIRYKRVYNHNYEETSRWPELLAILDASTNFSTQRVLLKKG
jgi:hypothetical protein